MTDALLLCCEFECEYKKKFRLKHVKQTTNASPSLLINLFSRPSAIRIQQKTRGVFPISIDKTKLFGRAQH